MKRAEVKGKLPVSAMIVGYNESHFLPACLDSVSFCEEIVYIDLGSTDSSISIAEKYVTSVRKINKVPSGEYAQSEVVKELKNDWVIFIDPDEVIDKTLQQEIQQNFEFYTTQPQLGAVIVSWIFYFKNRKLQGTIWGGVNEKILLVNRNRFLFLPITHHGRKLIEGYTSLSISFKETNCLHHYWMRSYLIFLKKHLRYLKKEGVDQYNMGRRIGLKTLAFTPFKYFWECFYEKKGFKDGLLGFNLSIFWAWYQSLIVLKILRLQMNK